MQFRVIVLLLLGIGPFIEYNMTDQHIPLINELVWNACRAIRNGSEPRVISTLLRGYKTRESSRLQKLLLIGITGKRVQLTTDEQLELQKKPSKVRLSVVFQAAKRNNLLARDASLRRLNRKLLATAIGETELEFSHQWLEVKSMIYQKADLTQWEIWRMKIDTFIYIFMTILPLPIHLALVWGVIFFTTSFIIAGGGKLRWLRNLAAILIPLIIIVLLVKIPVLEWSFDPFFGHYRQWGSFIYILIFAVIFAIYGMRLKCKLSGRELEWQFRQCLLTVTGLLLLFPFLLYSTSHFCLGYYWFNLYKLSLLNLTSVKLFLPLEFIGMAMLAWTIGQLNKRFGATNVKLINIPVTLLGIYIAWGIGGLVLFHRWVAVFLTKHDMMTFPCNIGFEQSPQMHLEQNIAFLVIAMLMGFVLPKFTQLTKTERIINIVMIIALLLVILQFYLF
jgi:hypothetical protein